MMTLEIRLQWVKDNKATKVLSSLVHLCQIHADRQTRQDGLACVVSGGVN